MKRYHVTLKKKGNAAIRSLNDFLKTNPESWTDSVAACSSLNAQDNSTHHDVFVYKQLGIADLYLSEQQFDSLSNASAEVLAVEEEMLHYLPPFELDTGESSSLDDRLDDIVNDVESRMNEIFSPQPPSLNQHTQNLEFSQNTTSWPLEMLGISSSLAYSGRNVGVCVIDTGLDFEHDDFKNRVAKSDKASFTDDNDPNDYQGHGTHCAGIAAGPRSTQSGTRYGVAPDCRLMVANVFGKNDTSSSTSIIKAMNWATQNGAKILSMSLGSARSLNQSPPIFYQQAFDIATSMGVLPIVSAGNNSRRSQGTIAPVGSPAACNNALAVAAIDRLKQVTDFSSGETDSIGKLAISAPGKAIYSSWINNSYNTISGTSMACPHISGLAAILWEAFPSATTSDIIHYLTTHVDYLGSQRDYGKGLPQIRKILP